MNKDLLECSLITHLFCDIRHIKQWVIYITLPPKVRNKPTLMYRFTVENQCFMLIEVVVQMTIDNGFTH